MPAAKRPKAKSVSAKKASALRSAKADYVIHCGYFLAMAGGRAEVERNRALFISGEKITRIAPWKPAFKKEAKRFIDASQKIVLPGFINAHTHLAMTLLRGMSDDVPFDTWIHKIILPAEAKLVTPSFVRKGTALGLREALLSGTTTVVDTYYYGLDMAAELERSGLRGWICETVADFPQPDNRDKAGNNWGIIEKLAQKYKGHARIQAAIGPHAPYTCSDETLKRVAETARRLNLPVNIHVSETKGEQEQSQKQYGGTPVERFAKIGFLDLPRSLYAHGVHLTDNDLRLMTGKKIAVVHNPESNMKLGCGAARLLALRAANIPTGLGTDGPASNNDLNMFGEMATCARLQKFVNSDNAAWTAADALRMATWEGAKALGWEDKIGSLEEGKLADIIVVDTAAPNMQPIHDVRSVLVYAANGSEVDTVFCHGRPLLQNRRPALFPTGSAS